MKTFQRKFRFQANTDETNAIMSVLLDQFANVRFWVTPTGLSNNFDLCFVIRSNDKQVTKKVAEKIEQVVITSLAAIRTFNRIMEGDDYDYAQQKNFD